MGTVLSGFEMTQARLAQSVEHQTFNLRVAGSSPSSGDENFEELKCAKLTNINSPVKILRKNGYFNIR